MAAAKAGGCSDWNHVCVVERLLSTEARRFLQEAACYSAGSNACGVGIVTMCCDVEDVCTIGAGAPGKVLPRLLRRKQNPLRLTSILIKTGPGRQAGGTRRVIHCSTETEGMPPVA
jgi:hypothetical protein